MHNPKLPNIQMVLLPTVYGSQLCRTWDHVVEIAIDWTWIPHSQTYRLLWQPACHCCVQESWTLHNKAHWFVWVRLTFTCFCLRLNYLLISAFLPQHLIGAMGMGINRFNVDFRYASQCRCGMTMHIYAPIRVGVLCIGCLCSLWSSCIWMQVSGSLLYVSWCVSALWRACAGQGRLQMSSGGR